MSTTSAKALALFSCFLSMSVTAIPMRAEDVLSKKSVRLDTAGDPLPQGAIARLGTLRLVHRGHVTAVAVSPDGRLVASGVQSTWPVKRLADGLDKQDVPEDKRAQSSPRGIRLWDARTGKLVRGLQTPEGQTSCLLFSADGADLYAFCGSHLACWNPHTGEKRWQKSTPDKGELHTSLPASSFVLAGDRLVSIHTGTLHCEFRGENWLSGSGHAQIAVRIWNRKTGVLQSLPPTLQSTTTTGKDIPVLFHDAAVSADGRFAAVVSSYGRLPWLEKGPAKGKEKAEEIRWQYGNPRFRIIDLGTGVVRHDSPAVNVENTHMAFSDEGSLLAIAAGKELHLMDVATGKKTPVAGDILAIEKLRFMPGTKRIAAQFADQSIRVWDCTGGDAVDPHAVRKHHFHASQHNRITAIGYGNSIRLFTDSGKPLLDFDGHREAPFICFGSGPENTLTSLDTERLYQWEAGTWNVRQHIRMQTVDEQGWHYLRWCRTELLVSPKKGLLLKDDEKALALHDLKSGKLVRTLESGAGKRWSSFFSQNGARVISMQESRVVSFDVATGKRLAAIDHSSGHPLMRWDGWGPSCSPVVSPLGTFFAKSDKCIVVDLIQMDTGKHLRKLSGDRGAGSERPFAILGLWFSPDERFILAEIHRQLGFSNEESAEIAVWDTERGAIVQEVMIVPRMQVWHRSSLQIRSVHALAMSSDLRLIALARRDHGDIEIWDTASATRRGILSGHEGAVTDIAFSRDGRYLASASDDTTVLIWDMNRPLQAGDFSDQLTEADLDASWRALAAPDAARADAAIWRLVKARALSVPFLKSHLRPQQAPDPKLVKRLLDDLDSPDFKTRSQAQADLARFRELVLSELRAALTTKRSLEPQRRIQLLLAQAERAALLFGTPDQVREWRALEILERIGSPEAVERLQVLAAGSANSALTNHAGEILARLRPATK